MFFITCLFPADGEPPASPQPTTAVRLVDVCRALLDQDREEGNSFKYSCLAPILGPCCQILSSRTPSADVPFQDLFARFINEDVARYVVLLNEKDCILTAETFVDFFLRGEIPVPIPTAVNSGIGAHGGELGLGRLPFFIHDLFHTSEIVRRVMPYHQYLKPLFESILTVTPDDKKTQVYYLLAMYIHEVAPDHNIYKVVTTPEQVLDAFFQHLQDRLVTKLSREFEEEKAENQTEGRSQQGNHGGHFAKELAQCAGVYEMAAYNCRNLNPFNWIEFIEEVKRLSHGPCEVESVPITAEKRFRVRVNRMLLVETLSPQQMKRVNLADLLRDLKGLNLVPVEVEFDAMTSGILENAFERLIRGVAEWSRLIPQISAGPQELLEIATVRDPDSRSIFPIDGCAIHDGRGDQRNVQLLETPPFLRLTEQERDKIRNLVAAKNNGLHPSAWHNVYRRQMVEYFTDTGIANQFNSLYMSAIETRAYLASRFAHVYFELKRSRQSVPLTLQQSKILCDRLSGEIEHELANSQAVSNQGALRGFQDLLRAEVRVAKRM